MKVLINSCKLISGVECRGILKEFSLILCKIYAKNLFVTKGNKLNLILLFLKLSSPTIQVPLPINSKNRVKPKTSGSHISMKILKFFLFSLQKIISAFIWKEKKQQNRSAQIHMMTRLLVTSRSVVAGKRNRFMLIAAGSL